MNTKRNLQACIFTFIMLCIFAVSLLNINTAKAVAAEKISGEDSDMEQDEDWEDEWEDEAEADSDEWDEDEAEADSDEWDEDEQIYFGEHDADFILRLQPVYHSGRYALYFRTWSDGEYEYFPAKNRKELLKNQSSGDYNRNLGRSVTYDVVIYDTKENEEASENGFFIDGEDVMLLDCRGYLYVKEAVSLCGERYWCIFDENGAMVKGRKAFDLFETDEYGVCDFFETELYKERKRISELTNITYEDGYPSGSRSMPTYIDIRKILSHDEASLLGRWVKKEDWVKQKEDVEIYGEKFETDSSGRIRLYADIVFENICFLNSCEMISSSVEAMKRHTAGYEYSPNPKYDWTRNIVCDKDYLSNYMICIDDDYYYFDENGYAYQNKWLFAPYLGAYYFGPDGKRVKNSVAPYMGELYYIGDSGLALYYGLGQCWVEIDGKHFYVSEGGKIDLTSTEKEYEVYKKILDFERKYPENTRLGACSQVNSKLNELVFGKNRKGTTTAFDFNKLKVGDSITYTSSYSSHVCTVYSVEDGYVSLAEGNFEGDMCTHYGRSLGLDDEGNVISTEGVLRNVKITSYYTDSARPKKDYTPGKPAVSVVKENNKAVITVEPAQFASFYRIYVSYNGGKYKCVKAIAGEDGLQFTYNMKKSGTYRIKVKGAVIVDGKTVTGDYSNEVTVKK